jgi:hypothetical protein
VPTCLHCDQPAVAAPSWYPSDAPKTCAHHLLGPEGNEVYRGWDVFHRMSQLAKDFPGCTVQAVDRAPYLGWEATVNTDSGPKRCWAAVVHLQYIKAGRPSRQIPPVRTRP